MEVHKSTMDVHQLSLDQMQKTSTAQVADKAEQDRIMAETEGTTFLGECSVLADLMKDENCEDSCCPIIAKALDSYMVELYDGGWSEKQAPTQF